MHITVWTSLVEARKNVIFSVTSLTVVPLDTDNYHRYQQCRDPEPKEKSVGEA